MLFNSIEYLFFFSFIAILYYLCPRKIRFVLLLAANYFFYACWNLNNVWILVYITAIAYISGVLLERTDSKKCGRAVILTAAVLCFGILFIYKYLDFILGNVSRIFEKINLNVGLPELDLLLPVGISFYIFQAFGYIVDISKGKIRAERNPLKLAAFVSFFPTLLSGPIERADNLLVQIKAGKRGSLDQIKRGLLMIAWGLFLKVAVADNIAPCVDIIYDSYSAYRGIEVLIATVLFGFQIYCDFAGYSYMAIGSAKVLGFDLRDNFKTPYLAMNVTEFWRRWHISLTSWFRDYVYIPLGGNRKGKGKKYRNTMIVFLLSGLWHGAGWSYLFWGGLNGLYVVAEDVFKTIRDKKEKQKRYSGLLAKVLAIALTFVLVDYAWLYFRADSFSQGIQMTWMMLSGLHAEYFWNGAVVQELGGTAVIVKILIGITILIIVDCLRWKKQDILGAVFEKPWYFRWSIYVLLLFGIIILGVYGGSYEQTEFIYFQF